MSFVMDWERERRTGVAEAVLCGSKSAAQIAAILDRARAEGRRLLLTRLRLDQFRDLPDPCRADLDFDPVSATAILGAAAPDGAAKPGTLIVAAGTSDLGAATEAARTLGFHGYAAPMIVDVGVAGLWRLMARLEELRAARVLLVAAGMEGALFSVVAGLVEAPVIALPTSVGYGVAAQGQVALHSALASCAPGVLAVNIDNGFGAAAAAIKILRISVG
ncbi:nickel pincer cofactor biosynthesis protein LarB [Acidisoma cellulosilytica]|uniref:Nickel pincer cofactor biosynthesis protein LarB n=1 Tax=Acidisoma cellulosilyticum TaxID=2802395 RepID=A0A963Z497_9PROT|nr:nickel pincer cofactor biosynthesis protein LarB [Acidisoma cellulosilyticum]MCB8882261.1 nickel pincer cofactor biosynthesis protein LarB [Acidisoma cellulosilyticum]